MSRAWRSWSVAKAQATLARPCGSKFSARSAAKAPRSSPKGEVSQHNRRPPNGQGGVQNRGKYRDHWGSGGWGFGGLGVWGGEGCGGKGSLACPSPLATRSDPGTFPQKLQEALLCPQRFRISSVTLGRSAHPTTRQVRPPGAVLQHRGLDRQLRQGPGHVRQALGPEVLEPRAHRRQHRRRGAPVEPRQGEAVHGVGQAVPCEAPIQRRDILYNRYNRYPPCQQKTWAL